MFTPLLPCHANYSVFPEQECNKQRVLDAEAQAPLTDPEVATAVDEPGAAVQTVRAVMHPISFLYSPSAHLNKSRGGGSCTPSFLL